jgi:hypothetical protein
VRRRVLYKICKKCISRARAPRARDAWDALIDIESDSVTTPVRRTFSRARAVFIFVRNFSRGIFLIGNRYLK